MKPKSPFAPEAWAKDELGVTDIPAESFSKVQVSLSDTIPPNGVQDIPRTRIPSVADLHISTKGFWAWLRTALNGAIVQYSGTAEVSFDDLQLQLERSRMAGIFGIDKASPIFDIQDVQTLQVPTADAKVYLALRTNPRRSVVLGLLLLVLGLPVAAALWFLSRRAVYRTRIGEQTELVPLRRLQRHDVYFRGHRLGALSRELSGRPKFSAQQDSVAVSVVPSPSSAAYDVHLRDGGTHQLTIEAAEGKGVAVAAPGRSDRRKPPPGPVPPAAPRGPGGLPRPGATAKIRRP
jgi:hypothetical protein